MPTDAVKPLNGLKTHPLTPHALEVLRQLATSGPQPRQTINAGVVNRFHREDLTETVQLPSPFRSHRGANIDHERITETGRTRLA